MVHRPHKIPIASMDMVKEELGRMECEEVIGKQREPTRWVNPIVTVIKMKRLEFVLILMT